MNGRVSRAPLGDLAVLGFGERIHEGLEVSRCISLCCIGEMDCGLSRTMIVDRQATVAKVAAQKRLVHDTSHNSMGVRSGGRV